MPGFIVPEVRRYFQSLLAVHVFRSVDCRTCPGVWMSLLLLLYLNDVLEVTVGLKDPDVLSFMCL